MAFGEARIKSKVARGRIEIDGAGGLDYGSRSKRSAMNFKLLCKAVLIVAILALLVMMGMYNNSKTVSLSLPPILPKTLTAPACWMYYGFFAVGFLAGTLLMAGGKRSAGKSGKDK